MTFKQQITRYAFYGECIIVLGLYCCGGNGVQKLWSLRTELDQGKQEVATIEQDITQLEQEAYAWEHDPFYVEQAAREKLAMSYDGENIYVVK